MMKNEMEYDNHAMLGKFYVSAFRPSECCKQ